MWGLLAYPKCRSGYSNLACCICRPNAPNCASYNLNPGVDLSCAKKIIIGDPVPMNCDSSQDKDGGLCYKKCNGGYTGVGPVCWASAPKGWVNCGMGAAKDSTTCAKIIWDQVSSVGTLALNIASLGSSAAATEGASAATKAAELSSLQKKFQQLKDLYEKTKDIRDLADKALKVKETIDVAQGAN